MRLLGREAEKLRVDGLLARARQGSSGALLVTGEPGIGKSAVLGYAAVRADDMLVLQTRGTETEVRVPFAALAELLRPVLPCLERIRPAHRVALSAALALSPPRPGDTATAYAATLSVLAEAAGERPLCLLVDDAHWLDVASLEAVLFTAARLDGERVALLLAARTGALGARRVVVPEMRLAGLGPADASDLIRHDLGRPVSEQVAARLVRATGGNPLALRSIAATLTAGQLDGRDALDARWSGAGRPDQVVRETLDPLSQTCRAALLVVAASRDGAVVEVARALAELGLPADALDPAQALGLVSTVDGRTVFSHPVVRSTVYATADPRERRAAHGVLASVLPPDRVGERAWHRAAAAGRRDEAAARDLESAAEQARGRSGYATAGEAMARGAELSIDDGDRARRLVQGAGDFTLAGRFDRALGLLGDPSLACLEPVARAAAHHLRGQLTVHQGAPLEASAILEYEAGVISGRDPGLACRMLVDATLARLAAGSFRTGVATAERARALGECAGGVPATLSAMALGLSLVFVGRAPAGLPMVRAALPALPDDPQHAHIALLCGAAPLVWVGDHAAARRILDRAVAHGETVAPSLLALALPGRANLEFRCGRWQHAHADASEAASMAAALGQHFFRVVALAQLATVEAGLGRDLACRASAAAVTELLGQHGGRSLLGVVDAARGLLALGLGRIDEARRVLESVGRLLTSQGMGEPGFIPWRQDLVEAHARAGATAEAREILAGLDAEAAAAGNSAAQAAAARCHGLLADADDFDLDFRRALDLHAAVPLPFEEARTRLCYGERLRRARRSSEAQALLRGALETFENLGAEPWAERARRELASTGETLRRRPAWHATELTAKEWQVALAVAEGASNREVAASLFVSPRTVDTHLTRIYRKLGVRSRAQLVRRLTPTAGPSG
jgi:DNA-binding CsgD family transcriptional regulator